MNCYFSFGTAVLNLPAAVLPHLKDADRLQMSVLLFAAHHNGSDWESFAADLRNAGIACNVQQVKDALAFWEQKGVLSLQKPQDAPAPSKPRLSELPQYSGAELAEHLTKNDNRLGLLIDRCQQLTGKLFTPTEVSHLVALVEYLGMDSAYVELLFGYCVERGKPSVGYVEKTARALYAEGVESVEALRVHLEKKRAANAFEPFVRRLLGLGERALTAREQTILERWVGADYSRELIQLAYETMIASTGKVSFPYMDKILQRWSQEGLTSCEEVRASQEKGKQEKAAAEGGSFETDEFFRLALKRGYQNAKKTEEQT